MPGRPGPLSPALQQLAQRQEGLLSVQQCVSHGVTARQIANRVRARSWQRPTRGVVDIGRPCARDRHDLFDHQRRRAAILGLLAHPGSVATGVSALVLHGLQGAPIEVVPEVALPTGAPRAPRPPVRLRRTPIEQTVDVGGFRSVPVATALGQAVPELRRRPAVALMDSALSRGDLTAAGLEAARRTAARRRGAARTRSWWGLADARAESPAETWARLSCLDEGLPPDALQLAIAGRDGSVFARVDLAWRLPDGTALLVEIDGQDVHSTPEAVFRDRTRQNRLATSRSIVRRFTGSDAWRGRVGIEVAAVLRQAAWRPDPLPPGTVLRLDT